MEREYTKKNAFDNRYKNTMIFSLFFIFGLSLIAFVDIHNGNGDWTDSLIAIIITIIFDILITIACYKKYYHISKHGTLIRNIPYVIIKDKGGIGLQIKYYLPKKGEVVFKYYRYHIEESKIGAKGNTDMLIDMKHPKYYYIFYK